MNCILLEQHEIPGERGRVVLRDRRREHAQSILGAEVGDVVQVGRVGGRLGHAEVAECTADTLVLDVELDRDPPPKLPVHLVLALPRPPVLRRVLVTATSLGVEVISLIGTARVEKSYWQSHALRPDLLREQLLLGLEQARDTRLPGIRLQRRFRPFAEDVLPEALAGARGFVAHPADAVLCPSGVAGAIVLCVGPEGGFNDYEVERLESAGCERISLGLRPLRVEAAVPALVGRLL